MASTMTLKNAIAIARAISVIALPYCPLVMDLFESLRDRTIAESPLPQTARQFGISQSYKVLCMGEVANSEMSRLRLL